MDKEFYKDELDVFLQTKADEHTMYPSERVWKGIRKNLFWRKNWFSITGGSIMALFLLFLIPESFLSNFFYTTPKTTGKTANEGSAAPILSSNPLNKLKAFPGNSAAPVSINTSTPILSAVPATKKQSLEIPVVLHAATLSAQPAVVLHDRNSIDVAASVTQPTVVTETAEKETEKPLEAAAIAELEEAPEQYHGDVNWLQELAVIKLTPKKPGRFNLQFYFSPLVSYRTLTDNGTNARARTAAGPMAASQIDINQYVDHQPSMGVELGSNVLFKAGNNLTFKSGLQLNYSRYTIKAYKVGYEKASIALNNSFGKVADTLSFFTTIRNLNGYTQEQLQNQYFQVSMPIGAELKLLGNKRFQINIAGTIQPTLLLLNDTYLLSTNYTNYIKEPSLIRRWNVHSSAEAYISYQFATVRWQVGPQFRYQLLSSYNDRYPIKEYLMEYGIKFGISKTLR